MIETIKTCAFTGHRPKSFSFGYNENTEEFLQLKNRIRNSIIQLCNGGCRTFYCGMAEGADLWCGEIVLELQNHYEPPLEICAVVPYLSQPNKMTEKNQERYRRIMNNAKERFLVSREFSEACFLKRNRFLVDNADAIIAVYKDGEDRTGTGQTIRYAKKKRKKILYVFVT